ncbi:MAG TPA: Uma2 family endonuclease [Rhodothermales bacterium]|nr:Uma2 family endonuclease [Rhodothermales bacterium]
MKVPTLEQRLFTVQEYHLMGEAGILHEDDRIELIAGKLITLPPIGAPHLLCVNRMTKLFVLALDRAGVQGVEVSPQNPVRLGQNDEPQPDLVLLRELESPASFPSPEDIVLLVEVADMTLRYDRRVKVPMYAAAGVPEVWIVDIGGDRIEVYRDPEGKRYKGRSVYSRGETIGVVALPALETFSVDEILGPEKRFAESRNLGG